MPSEASRKKADALLASSFVEHTEECQHRMWDEPGCTCGRDELRDEIATVLDAARAEGVQEGEERERWACWNAVLRIAEQCGGACKATCLPQAANDIAARGRMRGPEE